MALDWTAPMVDRLRALWDGGTVTAEIGRVLSAEFGLDVTKNAVIGKVSRMEPPWVRRASPINIGAAPRRVAPSAAVRSPNRSAARRAFARDTRVGEAEGRGDLAGSGEAAPAERPPAEALAALSQPLAASQPPVLAGSTVRQPGLRAAGCCWPMWGAKERPTHVYCNSPRDTGHQAYCAKHRAVSAGRWSAPEIDAGRLGDVTPHGGKPRPDRMVARTPTSVSDRLHGYPDAA